ncbi:hypothetical protein CDAR_524551 [Caerostris darwini]|uniref:Uncharacterized protein n=1 Tax=Caerostris darwini TaxID=1538125 RepID=A0AAV4PUK7_9ARAC|nr:hypothetical protein CDAR_524551 [Caerostris darwini]
MSPESVSKEAPGGRACHEVSVNQKRHRWNEEPFPFILFLPNPAILLDAGKSKQHAPISFFFVLWLTHDDKCSRTRNFLVDRSCHVILT